MTAASKTPSALAMRRASLGIAAFTKVIGDFFDSKPKSTVPPEREPVALRFP